MRRLRAWLVRVIGMFGKPRRDRELAGEIESQLQLHVDDNLRAGMTPDGGRCRNLDAGGSRDTG